MSLRDDIHAANRPANPRCAVAITFQLLEQDDAKDLEAALTDPTILGTAIASALNKRGFTIRAESIQRHRRGGCACGTV